jgi:adenylate cyclase
MASMAAERKDGRQRVACVINGERIEVWQGYRLWDAALDARARLWQWCGGHGQCTTCAVLPISGGENLSPPTGVEKFSLKIWFAKPLAFVRKRWRGRPVRLACQSYVNGPVEVVGLFGKKAGAVRAAKGLE